jgi:hypothetical protein
VRSFSFSIPKNHHNFYDLQEIAGRHREEYTESIKRALVVTNTIEKEIALGNLAIKNTKGQWVTLRPSDLVLEVVK